MRRAREAIDAAMFAAAIGIDRLVKANIGRIVAGDDRAGMFDRDLRSGPGDRPVYILHRIEPVAIGFTLGQGKTRTLRVECCASSFLHSHDQLRT